MNSKIYTELFSQTLFESVFFNHNFNNIKMRTENLTTTLGSNDGGGLRTDIKLSNGDTPTELRETLAILSHHLGFNITLFNQDHMVSLRNYAKDKTLVVNSSLSQLTEKYEITRVPLNSNLITAPECGNDAVRWVLSPDFKEVFDQLLLECNPDLIVGDLLHRGIDHISRITIRSLDGDLTYSSHIKFNLDDNTIEIATLKDCPKGFESDLLSKTVIDTFNTLRVKSIF